MLITIVAMPGILEHNQNWQEEYFKYACHWNRLKPALLRGQTNVWWFPDWQL